MAIQESKSNCFDLLRLFLAVMVLYTHASLIGGFEGEPGSWLFVKNQWSFGSLAVLGFFGISGFLVTASWDRRRSTVQYFKNRVLRIFPGFLVCLVFVAFVVAPLLHFFRNQSLNNFPIFGDQSAFSYVTSNSLLRVKQWSIGSVLEGAHYDESLNGSKWSIFPEFQCYIVTCLIGVTGVYSKNKVFLAGLVLYVVLLNVIHLIAPGDKADPLFGPSLLMLGKGPIYILSYLVGMLMWVYRDRYEPSLQIVLFLGMILAISMRFGGLKLVAPVVFPAFLICLSFCFEVRLKWDLSYGIYLYHFPLFQLLSLNSFLSSRFAGFFISGLLMTILVAMASWFFVEAPLIRRKKSGAIAVKTNV